MRFVYCNPLSDNSAWHTVLYLLQLSSIIADTDLNGQTGLPHNPCPMPLPTIEVDVWEIHNP